MFLCAAQSLSVKILMYFIKFFVYDIDILFDM